MKLNIKIFANMKEYYYTINNSNNKKEENEKNKSLISKFYNSVKKVGQKIQNLFELKVESNNENRNINEQRIYDNIEQINFYDVPSSLYESFTEQNSILNKDLNTFPKKMTREEYKKNPFNKMNYFSQKEVKNNFKEEEMIKNKNYYQNMNYYNFTQNYNNLSKEINPFKIENKNYNQNTFKLNKKRERENIINNKIEEDNNSPLKSENKIISNINNFQIEGNKINNINESNLSISSTKNNNNTSLMSMTLRSLDDIKNDIDKKRLESIKEIEKFRGKYFVSYDFQKDYQTRKNIIANYYKKKLDKFEEITLKSEKEKNDRLESFKKLKKLKEESFNIKGEKKPKITLSTMKSGEMSFSGINKNNNNNENNNNNNNNSFSLFNSFGDNNSFNNNNDKNKDKDNKSSLIDNKKKEENKTSLFNNDKKEENTLFENKKNGNSLFGINTDKKEIDSSNKEKTIFSSNNETKTVFSNNNEKKENNPNPLFADLNKQKMLFQVPQNLTGQINNPSNNNSETQKSIFQNEKTNIVISSNPTSLFSSNNIITNNNINNNGNNKLFENVNFSSPTKQKESNSLFGGQTITMKDNNPISASNIENKTSIFQSNNLSSSKSNNSSSLVNDSNPFLNNTQAQIANVFSSPDKNNNNDINKPLFQNQIKTSLFGNSNNGNNFFSFGVKK